MAEAELHANPLREPLTRDQVRGFWAAWAGWTLDGMDSFIFALVLAPAAEHGPARYILIG